MMGAGPSTMLESIPFSRPFRAENELRNLNLVLESEPLARGRRLHALGHRKAARHHRRRARAVDHLVHSRPRNVRSPARHRRRRRGDPSQFHLPVGRERRGHDGRALCVRRHRPANGQSRLRAGRGGSGFPHQGRHRHALWRSSRRHRGDAGDPGAGGTLPSSRTTPTASVCGRLRGSSADSARWAPRVSTTPRTCTAARVARC